MTVLVMEVMNKLLGARELQNMSKCLFLTNVIHKVGAQQRIPSSAKEVAQTMRGIHSVALHCIY